MIENTQSSFLIAGLGNPGREYRANRHNIGFMVVDCLVERLNPAPTGRLRKWIGARGSAWRMESKALVIKTDYEGNRLVLAKPQTFMNGSGNAVGALVRFYKIPMENVLVVYDDVDLPFGTLRLRPSGGSGGHKGMASIIENLGTQDFPRLRAGIGRPPGKKEAADYVLQGFRSEEAKELPLILERAGEAVLAFTTQGLEAAMNRYNPVTSE